MNKTICFFLFSLVIIMSCNSSNKGSSVIKSCNLGNSKAITKGSPVYKIDKFGNMEKAQFFDANGNPVSIDVISFAKVGKNWLMFHFSNSDVLLISTETGIIYDITGFINSNFLYGVERKNHIYFGNADKHIIYRLTKKDGSIVAMNDPDQYPIDFQQSQSYPGFYVFENDIVLTIVQPSFRVFFGPGIAPEFVIPNPPSNFMINSLLWDYIPAGNNKEIYDIDGSLFEISSNFLNNMGIWNANYKIRQFIYSSSLNQVTDGYSQTFMSYGDCNDTTIASISNSTIPTWLLNPKNRIDRDNQNQYIISPAGYIKVQQDLNSSLSAAFQQKDLSAVSNDDFWIHGDYVYWKDNSNFIKRILLSPSSNAEIIINDNVESWGIANNFLIYNTSESTKKINLDDPLSTTEIIASPAIHISVFVKMGE